MVKDVFLKNVWAQLSPPLVKKETDLKVGDKQRLLRGEDHQGLKGLEWEPIKSTMSSSNVEAPQRLGLLL